jgi:hypothetical protein
MMARHQQPEPDYDHVSPAIQHGTPRLEELLAEQWKKVTMAKLPDATELLKSSPRIG